MQSIRVKEAQREREMLVCTFEFIIVSKTNKAAYEQQQKTNIVMGRRKELDQRNFENIGRFLLNIIWIDFVFL